MRLPLATTLKNRSNSLTKDARLLNAVVDSKQRVMKRPALNGTFQTVTPGTGLGLFVRTTPHAPDDTGDEELIVISGSTLTTGPSAFFNGYEFISGSLFLGAPFGTVYGFSVGSSIGSLSPQTLSGQTIVAIITFSGLGTTAVSINGNLSQSFFASVTINGTTLLSSAAGFTPGPPTTAWGWTSSVLDGLTGPVSLSFS